MDNPYQSPPALPDERSERQRRVDWWRAILFAPSHPVLVLAPPALLALAIAYALGLLW